ncbi:MAG: 16S rRNA (guanine(527)-N(7))-methyltransferase RsmG [Streptosporangiaceae bacterium]
MPAASAAARTVFGPALGVAEHFAQLLAGAGVQRGLIGPAEAGRIWERHLLNCAVVAELVPEGGMLADLGSGAGLPGIVLAMLRPATEVVLIEPMARRTAFLSECVTELGLANVRVERSRAEDLAGRVEADVVTARAVAPLERLAVLADGLARRGGLVLAMKGSSAADEIERSGAVLNHLGVSDVRIVTAGAGVIEPAAIVVSFRTALIRPGPAGPEGRGSGRPPGRRRR